MKYTNYLKNKNLAKSTIHIYEKNANAWISSLNNKNPTKSLFVGYINKYAKNHSANSTRLLYSSILSYIRFQKKWKLYNECHDIKLPSIVQTNKVTISLEEFNLIKDEKANLKSWHQRRDWLIFSFLFSTGIRVSELHYVNKKNINQNILMVNGKGNKDRVVYISDYLMNLLNQWRANRINISINNDVLTNKQINKIIKKMGKDIFNKNITPHSLRRSFATNLLRNSVDIKTICNLLGHANINTTSRYIQLTDGEIIDNIKRFF